MKNYIPSRRRQLLVTGLRRRDRNKVLRGHQAENEHDEKRDDHNDKNILAQRPKQSLH